MVASPILIRHSLDKVSSGDRSFDHRLVMMCLGLVLAVSPGGQVFLPFGLGAAPNLAIAVATLVLAFVALPHLRPLPDELRSLARISLLLLVWGAVVSALSEYPATSLRYWTKGILYGAFFWVLVGICRVEAHRRSVEMALLLFLAGLAVFGVVETAAPDLPLFAWLRVPHSLTIRPRIASVLSWPNTLGALMVVGVSLSESLFAAGRIIAPAAMALTSLFVFITAQSGSRNAWTTMCVALALLVVRRRVSLPRSAAIAFLFGVFLLCLPVPRFQIGFLDTTALPVSETHATTGRAPTSLAEPLQSLSLRNMLWNDGLTRWRSRPLQGIGMGVFSTQLAPILPGNTRNQNLHSLPLNILVEMGIPGLFLAIAWLRSVMRAAGFAQTSVVALMASLVAQIFDNFLYDPGFTLVFLGLCAVTVAAAPARPTLDEGTKP